MAESLLWQILETVQDAVQTLTFAPQGSDTVPAIDTTKAVVIRKYRTTRPENVTVANEAKPGWIISPGPVASTPPEGGVNERDETNYSIFLQLIDKDYDGKPTNLRSYLKWQEQVRRLLNHYFAANCLLRTEYHQINDSFAASTMVVDEKRFVRHQDFVCGVELTVQAWETRGAQT